ncbi:MAG: M50 family metallopeptidase [Clostridia bacterium]|nr:M50 family metallopeptidase [Clostridia bacterium]
MISNILYILLAILILGVIVTFHEFGHYLVGRLTGIGILEFSVGMGPKLLGWSRKGIDYSLRAVPLGGYCKFKGEDEKNDAPDAFNNAAVWKRFLTVLAGPVMNGVLALLAAMVLLALNGSWNYAPVVGEVIEDLPAAQAGLQAGDLVVDIDGVALSADQAGMERMQQIIGEAQAGQTLTFTVEREGETHSFSITPEYSEEAQKLQIGIYFGYLHETYSALELAPQSFRYLVNMTAMMLDSLKQLVFGGYGLDQTMGPVGIISTVGTSVQQGFQQTAQQGFAVIFYMIVIISLNLGIMNLLPLPALDGGRLVFLIVEGVRRRPIDPDKEGMVHGIGFLLLLGLIVVITYQDITRMIFGS